MNHRKVHLSLLTLGLMLIMLAALMQFTSFSEPSAEAADSQASAFDRLRQEEGEEEQEATPEAQEEDAASGEEEQDEDGAADEEQEEEAASDEEQQQPEATPTPIQPIEGPVTADEPFPQEATAYGVQWPLPNRDYSSARAVLDSPINAQTVGELGLAWTMPIPGRSSYGAAASNPLIIGDQVIFQDLGSNVFAINLHSGEIIWEQRYDLENLGPNGPAVGWGRVFINKGAQEIAALDATTGTELWSNQLTETEWGGIDIQPIAYDGLVYVSTVPGHPGAFYAGGVAGIIYALDYDTGEVVWSFNTIQDETLWGFEDINSGGGAWYPAAIDPERGVTYWGIGNPAPWPGVENYPNAASRSGDNLYSNSVVALDHATGELLWFNQVLAHDLFDLDFQNTPILATIELYGEQRDVVIGSGKTGTVNLFDREAGEMIWQAAVGEHRNDRLDQVPFDETIEVCPGTLGGVETPIAYAEGVVYVPIVNACAEFTATESLGTDLEEGTGELVALTADTGKILWKVDLPSMIFGGATVVNDLVFTADYEGMIYAFDRSTGEEVWTLQAPAGINAWPAVAGDTIVWPAGVGEDPQLIALRLGATDDMENGDEAAEEDAAEEPDEADDEEAEEAEAADGEADEDANDEADDEAAAAQSVEVELVEYEIRMPQTIAPGQVTFEITNSGSTEHGFVIEGEGFEEGLEDPLAPDESATLEVMLEPGNYEVYCPVNNHADEGMRLELTVSEEDEAQDEEEQPADGDDEEPAAEEDEASEEDTAEDEEAEDGGEEAAELDGEQLVQEKCTLCHDLSQVEQASYDEAGWQDTVERMISLGCPVTDEELPVIVEYLAANY